MYKVHLPTAVPAVVFAGMASASNGAPTKRQTHTRPAPYCNAHCPAKAAAARLNVLQAAADPAAPAMAISSLLSFTPRVPSESSCSTTQLKAASLAARWVRTTCCSSYLARLQVSHTIQALVAVCGQGAYHCMRIAPPLSQQNCVSTISRCVSTVSRCFSTISRNQRQLQAPFSPFTSIPVASDCLPWVIDSCWYMSPAPEASWAAGF